MNRRRPLVAVLGASGTTGRAAVMALPAHYRVRLGSRHATPLHELAPGDGARGGGTEVWAVDLWDSEALAEFCAGCAVVLNCAGPSYRIGGRVANAAVSAGADYVDVSGDDAIRGGLADARGRVVVLAAGLQPGVSAILPRWAADGFTAVTRITAYAGGLEPVTPAAAADYLISLDGGQGTALAAWRDGRRAERVLRPLADADLPGFPERVAAHPYLSAESERLAAALGLIELDWYNVIAGERLRLMLGRLRDRSWSGAPHHEVTAACDLLARAASIDLAGRTPYQVMTVRVHGGTGDRTHDRTVTLRTTDGYQVTGATGALAVRAIVDGRVPPGVHDAADVLDPATILTGLEHAGAAFIDVDDAPGDTSGASGAYEEGIL